MYKATDKIQSSFTDFNQPIGLHMNPNNRWIQMADMIPWNVFEKRYAALFPSSTGNVAKPLRMALGALIIQTRYQFSDLELVEQIQENPYYQYFVGLPGYQTEKPFEASVLVSFRKRLTAEIISEANEYILNPTKDSEPNKQDKPKPPTGPSYPSGSSKDQETEEPENIGTLILDASCAPSNIKYPQDFQLLNNAREKLETIIDRFCKEYSVPKPRMYRKEARKNYLKLAKCKKRSIKKIRATIRKQLGYVKRNMGFLEGFISGGCELTPREVKLVETIYKVYGQQEHMYRNKTHSVNDRIVSISQPYLRPIVRGKVKAPVEFGAKFDISVVDGGFARIEKLSFDSYNESTCLEETVERYYQRNGYYPERVLADQIYRNKHNRDYCKTHGIRLSGPKLGRPGKTREHDKRVEYQDNVDRIEVERAFSLAKRCYSLGLIRTKLEETTLTSISLSIFVMNLFKVSLCPFLKWVQKSKIKVILLLKRPKFKLKFA